MAMSYKPGLSGLGQATVYLTAADAEQDADSIVRRIVEKQRECTYPVVIIDDFPGWTSGENTQVAQELVQMLQGRNKNIPSHMLGNTIFILTSDYAKPYHTLQKPNFPSDSEVEHSQMMRSGFREFYNFYAKFTRLNHLENSRDIPFPFLKSEQLMSVFRRVFEQVLCEDNGRALAWFSTVDIPGEFIEYLAKSKYGARANGRVFQWLTEGIEHLLEQHNGGQKPIVEFVQNQKVKDAVAWTMRHPRTGVIFAEGYIDVKSGKVEGPLKQERIDIEDEDR